MSVRSRRNIKREFIRRSLEDGKYGRVLTLQRLVDKVRVDIGIDLRGLFAFLTDFEDQPQAVRALNLIEERSDSSNYWSSREY